MRPSILGLCALVLAMAPLTTLHAEPAVQWRLEAGGTFAHFNGNEPRHSGSRLPRFKFDDAVTAPALRGSLVLGGKNELKIEYTAAAKLRVERQSGRSCPGGCADPPPATDERRFDIWMLGVGYLRHMMIHPSVSLSIGGDLQRIDLKGQGRRRVPDEVDFTQLALGAGPGIEWRFAQRWRLLSDYRYAQLLDDDIEMHSLSLRLGYRF